MPNLQAWQYTQRLLMNALSISLLAVLLLPLAATGNKAKAAESVKKQLTSEEKFVVYTKKKAAAGNAVAQLNLGWMYDKGDGVPKDVTKAVKWYQKAAAQGQMLAQFKLGWIYDKGDGFPRDAAKAVEWYQKSAAQGYASAQYSLGGMYYKGDGAPKDAAKAAEWFQKAATQDHAGAQYNLGSMYYYGDGVPKDAAKAVEWYQKAAAQGNASAQGNLGVMYAAGEGVPKDAAKAVEWYQKAAAQGNASAQANLAVAYATGEGVPKDAAMAVEWWQKAAEQGHASAQFFLGVKYEEGDGVPKDATRAVGWYQKAAAQGDALAQANLGIMYYTGEGISKDMVRAYALFNLSAAQGNTGGIKGRDLLEKILTPAQLTEAQRLASNWKKGDTLQASGDNPSNSTSPDGKPRKSSTGTAFAVSREGHALTNHHVINGCTEVKIAGREDIAKVITSDSVNDLALLQLPGKTKDIASLNPDLGKLRQGEDIIVFGYPLEWALSSGGNLTPGIISAITGLGNNTNQIQITAPIQPGSSGSPVMDKKGHVVGMVSMKLSDSMMAKATGSVGQNVNFAVNGQTVKAFLDLNKVPYRTGNKAVQEKRNTTIAEEAGKWTVLVECWK